VGHGAFYSPFLCRNINCGSTAKILAKPDPLKDKFFLRNFPKLLGLESPYGHVNKITFALSWLDISPTNIC
jgi:hypothetical protein